MMQVLGNLVSNALRYTPARGKITLRPLRQRGVRWIITVKDNGIGIPADELPHIFDRFTGGINPATAITANPDWGWLSSKALVESQRREGVGGIQDGGGDLHFAGVSSWRKIKASPNKFSVMILYGSVLDSLFYLIQFSPNSLCFAAIRSSQRSPASISAWRGMPRATTPGSASTRSPSISPGRRSPPPLPSRRRTGTRRILPWASTDSPG